MGLPMHATAATCEPDHRDRLVAEHTGFVRMLAARCYRRRYCQELEYGDYLQFGMIGLLEAIDRFDPSQGVAFEAFARRRILGAILNGVESLSEKQRQISTRQRVRAERAQSLAEASEHEGRPADALQRLADIAIGLAIGFMLEDTALYVDGDRASRQTPYARVELAQLRQHLGHLVERLPEQERRVIRYHYYQQIPFEEIARGSGLSKGRISQIHRAALERLRRTHAELGGAQLLP